MPNVDEVAGGSREHEQRLELHGQRRCATERDAWLRREGTCSGCHRPLHPGLASCSPSQAPPQAAPRSPWHSEVRLGRTSTRSPRMNTARATGEPQGFSRCFPGPSQCSCGPARGRGAVGCGARPEAVPGSASTRPNRDGAAGGIREGEQRLELQGREERLLSATLASEDMALALAATGRSIPVWPRARGARHRLRPHPAAQGAPRSGWAV